MCETPVQGGYPHPNKERKYIILHKQNKTRESTHIYTHKHTCMYTHAYTHTNSQTHTHTLKHIPNTTGHQIKVPGINNHWTIISLNIIRLNVSMKRNRIGKSMQAKYPLFCFIQEIYLSYNDRYNLRYQGLKKHFLSKQPK